MHYRALSCLTALLALVMAAWQPAAAAPATQGQPAARATPSAQAAPHASANTAVGASPAAGSKGAPGAKRKAYYIEIIVFRARVALGSPEDWAAETGMAPTVTGGESANGSDIGQLLDLVPPSQYRLTSIAQALRRSPTYKVVAHAAWKQTASDWGSNAGFTLQQLGIDVPGLTGEVTFERGTFLHLGLKLDYSIAHPPAGLDAAPGTTFVLNEMRRVRFYQRNYYDNPAFGVIALVLPVRTSQPPGR